MGTLDSVASLYLENSKTPVLKIDAQGFEWQVLDGPAKTLPNLSGIVCELSLVPLYEGQHLWLDLIQRLREGGFELWGFHRGFVDPRDGRSLQVDASFFRPGARA